MSQKRVRIIDVVVERKQAGLAVATCPALPDFYLVTKESRLDEDIPDALQRFYRVKDGSEIEVLPVETDDSESVMQWAAILAPSRSGVAA